MNKTIVEKVFEFSKGLLAYSPEAVKEMLAIENTLVNNLAMPLHFEQWILPHLIPNTVFQQYWNLEATPFKTSGKLVLDPLAISFYQFISEHQDLLPIRLFERTVIHRHESKPSVQKGILFEFRRIELFYVDTPQEVMRLKEQILKSFLQLLQEWKLPHKVVVLKDEKG